MGKKSSKRARNVSTSSDDWISALAKQSTTDESVTLPSKSERIERREAKKRRRQERHATKTTSSLTNTHDAGDSILENRRLKRSCEASLKAIERNLECRVVILTEKSNRTSKPYQRASAKKGKATAGSRLNDSIVQPRRRDYGGLGLARPSMFIALHDPSFVPKLEEEFAEHIPGFFGKQKTKAMKKQLDGNMLWRQLAEKRVDDHTVGGRKLSAMTPDERVEAMIKAGIV